MNQSIRRRRRRQENRIKLIAVLIATAILLIFLFNVLLTSTEVRGEMDTSGKGYIAITIHANDTLWSLAEEYMNKEYYTFETFIAEVSHMNDLDSSQIYAGEQILIPIIASID